MPPPPQLTASDPLTTTTPEELNAYRDEVVAYLDQKYEPETWQMVTTSGRAATPTWNDGVWLAWDSRGGLVGLIGASDGWYPKSCAYPPMLDLELSQPQFDKLPSLTAYNDRRAISP